MATNSLVPTQWNGVVVRTGWNPPAIGGAWMELLLDHSLELEARYQKIYGLGTMAGAVRDEPEGAHLRVVTHDIDGLACPVAALIQNREYFDSEGTRIK
jgi:hypothetical protein